MFQYRGKNNVNYKEHQKTDRRTKSKKRKKQKWLDLFVEIMLILFLAAVPLFLILLYGLGVGISPTVIGGYSAASYIIGGILIIVFSSREKFGLGKAGYGYNIFAKTGFKKAINPFRKAGSFLFMSKEEAKKSECFFGALIIAIGLFFAVLTCIKG